MIYVVTAITNGFDNLREPKVVSNSENVRYVCFTNLPNLPNVGPWQYRPLHDIGRPGRSNRVPKILPHLMLPTDAEYSIWHDGNFQLSALPEVIIDTLLRNHDWAAHRHPCRNCIYEEAGILLREKIGTPELVEGDVARYRASGYPSGAGLWANGMIVRRHSDVVVDVCEEWWKAYVGGCERDQLSFPPVRHRRSLSVETIDAEIYSSPYMNFYWHAPWKNQMCNQEFLPERSRIRGRLQRLTELTGKNGLECPEF